MVLAGHLERWGAVAGLVAWVAVGVPVLAGDLIVAPVGWWWVAYLGYGLLLGLALRPQRPVATRFDLMLLAAQLVAGATAFVLDGGYGFSSVLLIVNAAAAALLLPLWLTGVVVAAQSALMVATHRWVGHGPTDLLPIVEAAAFAGMQVFVIATVEVALQERRARAEATALTFELAAAQSQLANATRTTERLRIARDMHDTIGHQLTAIAVNLEVATHLVQGPGADHVERSRRIVKDLLTDVRDLVSRTREPEVDLSTSLRSMLDNAPGLAVQLSVDPGPPLDPDLSDAVRRCVQEILTNTLRHAAAEHLWITISRSASLIEIHARDDGRGTRSIRAGHGLTGMTERCEELGGTVDFRARPGEGFRVDAQLPLVLDPR